MVAKGHKGLQIQPSPPGGSYAPRRSLWVRPSQEALRTRGTRPSGFRFLMEMALIFFCEIPRAPLSRFSLQLSRPAIKDVSRCKTRNLLRSSSSVWAISMKPYVGRVRNMQYVRRPATDTFPIRYRSVQPCIASELQRTPLRSWIATTQTRIWPDESGYDKKLFQERLGQFSSQLADLRRNCEGLRLSAPSPVRPI